MARVHRDRNRDMEAFMTAINGSSAWNVENVAIAIRHALEDHQAKTVVTISCNDCRFADDCPGFNDCPFIYRDPYDDTSPTPEHDPLPIP
jgi:hypothetical protein